MIGKIAVATAFIGLLLLIILSQVIEPRIVKISEIDGDMMNEYVKVSGMLTSVKITNGVTIMEINDGEKISAVVFDEINLTKDMKVEVTGKVVEYNNKIEIEAQKVRQLSKKS